MNEDAALRALADHYGIREPMDLANYAHAEKAAALWRAMLDAAGEVR